MILEYHKLDEPNSGWIHCSYKAEDNRKQILRAYRNESGKTCYETYEPKWKEKREELRNSSELINDHLQLYRST